MQAVANSKIEKEINWSIARSQNWDHNKSQRKHTNVGVIKLDVTNQMSRMKVEEGDFDTYQTVA